MNTDFDNFEKFLASIDSDVKKIFDYQKEYIHCQKGCSLCCQKGDYPISEIEFNYLMQGFNRLEGTKKALIQKNINKLKEADKDSYTCPFLVENSCSVYQNRPFVCRMFGVLTEDAAGNPTFPFCTTEGLNYSEIYDPKTQHLSMDLVFKKNFKVFPKFFRLSNRVILNLPLAKELNIQFGETKRMIDFFD